MDEGFDMTNKHIDNVEIKVDSLKKHVDMKFVNLENKMEAKFTDLKEDVTNLTKVVNKIAAKIL